MGLFGSGGLGGFFDRVNQGAVGAQMALAGDYSGLASMHNQRARLRAEQEQAEAEARARAQQIEAASQLLGPNGQPLFSKAQLNSLSSSDLSQLTREMFSPVNRGPEGGVTTTRDPVTGLQRHERSPGRVTDQGRIIEIDASGNARESFNARANDIEWVTGPWGSFATDSSGRPITPGTNIQSSMGQPPGMTPGIGDGIPGNPPAASRFPMPSINQPQGLDPEAIFGRMIQRESRGQQFDRNGRPLRSPAGAIGVAQVMPGTGPEAAALAGLPWDPRRLREDPQYNAALGQAYFQRQLETFGDPVLAAAAYNAGPQRIRNALRRGGANWQAHIPQETRDYVRAVFGEGARGTQTAQGGAPNIPGQGRSIQDQAAGGFVQAPQQAPPGMRWTPQGGLEPIQGSEQDYGRQYQNQQAIGQVVQQYRTDPIVREWQQARTSTMQLQSLGQSGRPSDDVAIIFQFMKALDPSSTVREGEVAMAQQTSLPDRIRNYYNEAVRGNLLGEQQRRDLIATAGRLYTERSRNYNEHIQSYGSQLRAMGVENPGELGILTAMAPITEDRRRREQRNNFNPQDAVDAARSAMDQAIPGSPSRVRITRRRRR